MICFDLVLGTVEPCVPRAWAYRNLCYTFRMSALTSKFALKMILNQLIAKNNKIFFFNLNLLTFQTLLVKLSTGSHSLIKLYTTLHSSMKTFFSSENCQFRLMSSSCSPRVRYYCSFLCKILALWGHIYSVHCTTCI